MGKKIISIICTIAVFLGMVNSTIISAEAADQTFSAPPGFIQEGSARGEMVKVTRGPYLQSGFCDMLKVGVGKIFVEGETVATQPVQEIMIHCAIQQWNERTQGWSQYDYLFSTDSNSSNIKIRQTIDVPRGYYYRTAATHAADGDLGYSYSAGVWIG